MLKIIVSSLLLIQNALAGTYINATQLINNTSTSVSLVRNGGKFWEPPLGETEISPYRKGKTWWFPGGLPFGFTSGVFLIENGICTGSNSLIGTCYTMKQCNRQPGGFVAGFCAQRYGRCCVTSVTCSSTASANNTYFQSPGFPGSYAGGTKCPTTIKRCDNTICQVRINFIRMSLAPPVGGVCSDDALTITGHLGNPIRVCGEMTGQHIYLDFNNADDIIVTVDTSASVSFSRYWQIQIAQITCDSLTRAPSGCLQYYYDGTSGSVSSFNYGTTLSDPISTSRQIRNLRYGICILRQPGYCGITWTPGSLYISETGSVPGILQNGAACTDNYVLIPGSPAWRYCGSAFPASVASRTLPFILYYVTSAAVGGGTTGFSLTWTQSLCDNSIIL